MLVSSRWVLLAWVMAVLLLANSLVILFNIFDFLATGISHLIYFVSVIGLFTGLLFMVLGVLQFLRSPKHG